MPVDHPLIESFPALESIPDLVHGFFLRHPDVDVLTDRDEAIRRLQPHYDECLNHLGIDRSHFWTGEQIHTDNIEFCLVEPSEHFADTDGLTTGTPGEYLGIYVADCGAVSIVDPVNRACALVHSGKKGTEMKISVRAIETMEAEFGSNPAELIVQLAPCIRPPAYEIDFAAQIVHDCIEAGVPESQVHDCGTCTSLDLDRYYSYRVEQGKTGRLLAVLGFSI